MNISHILVYGGWWGVGGGCMKYWNPKRATIDGGLIFIRRESLLPFYYVVEILCMEVYFVINNGTFFYVYHMFHEISLYDL